MKRAAIVVAVLGMCAWSFGQATNRRRRLAARGAGGRRRQRRRASGHRGEDRSLSLTRTRRRWRITDAAATEKAADDFATKFPDSELRGRALYSRDADATSRRTMPTR